MRKKLRLAARQIAANRNEKPSSPFTAFRKLFIQERRDWNSAGAPRTGWKHGELFEVLQAIFANDDVGEEWGDVGYYIAQTWTWLWWIYAFITPKSVIGAAVAKFQARAKG